MKRRTSIFSKFNHPKEVIFLRREYNSVKGKKNGILIMLTAILFFSLFSVVLGKAGLDYLNVKMNDPFIKWFNIPVSNANFRYRYTEIKRFFDQNAETKKYSISESTGSYRGLWRFFLENGGGTTAAFVQSFDFWKDRELFNSICSEDNVIRAFTDLSNLTPEQLKDGVIVSANLLKDIAGTNDPAELRAALAENKIMIKGGDYLPLTVLAVVRSLPNKSQVFAENSLVFTINHYGSSNVSGSSSSAHDKLSFYILAKSDDAEEAVQTGIAKILKDDFGLDFTGSVVKKPDVSLVSQNQELVFSGLSKAIDLQVARRINSTVDENLFAYNPALAIDHNLVVPHQNKEYGNPDSKGYQDVDMFDILSFKLDDLSQISAFQDVVLDRFEMELDMSQVEAKENFGVVSFMSIFLILSLVFFAGFAILIYLFNLMKGHLEKISVNLGTLLAFGLPKAFLYHGYMRILFKLIAIATALALVALTLLIVFIRLTLSLFHLPDFLGYMQVFRNGWLWMVIVVFFGISYLLFTKLLKRFLVRPPGDLIYNRL